jgi:hypothetical protein
MGPVTSSPRRNAWPTTVPAQPRLSQQLATLAREGNYDHIHIAAEATNNYWLTFFCALEQSPELADWPVTLYPFNPKVIHNFRKSLGDWNKTDDLDTTWSSLSGCVLGASCRILSIWKIATCLCAPSPAIATIWSASWCGSNPTPCHWFTCKPATTPVDPAFSNVFGKPVRRYSRSSHRWKQWPPCPLTTWSSGSMSKANVAFLTRRTMPVACNASLRIPTNCRKHG